MTETLSATSARGEENTTTRRTRLPLNSGLAACPSAPSSEVPVPVTTLRSMTAWSASGANSTSEMSVSWLESEMT
jgi:hypothetical protein